MKIMTNEIYEEILTARYEAGRERGRHERDHAEPRKKYEKFRDIPIKITNIALTKEPAFETNYTLYIGEMQSFEHAEYTVKFRFFNGMESEIIIAMDTPDFSMEDIRRKISKELIGDICGGTVE